MSTSLNKMFKDFAETIDYALLKEGINAAELAKRMDKHRSQVSQWTSGEHEPYPSSLRKMNNVLNVVHISKEKSSYVVTHKKRNESRIEANEIGNTYSTPMEKLEYAQKLLNDAIWEIKQKRKED